MCGGQFAYLLAGEGQQDQMEYVGDGPLGQVLPAGVSSGSELWVSFVQIQQVGQWCQEQRDLVRDAVGGQEQVQRGGICHVQVVV
ncbi:hypothetical protein B5D80_09170 [Micromonospora wenchangensis]|uniref:Uncharacterized protein n=2 Tax=Micromonospora wenchangensis TaxID=1185415 RepID=A0A246RR84_9ACTN|nr:hypothetical protein B5D80_09170 [Micromonospora wenchangensis]